MLTLHVYRTGGGLLSVMRIKNQFWWQIEKLKAMKKHVTTGLLKKNTTLKRPILLDKYTLDKGDFYSLSKIVIWHPEVRFIQIRNEMFYLK